MVPELSAEANFHPGRMRGEATLRQGLRRGGPCHPAGLRTWTKEEEDKEADAAAGTK